MKQKKRWKILEKLKELFKKKTTALDREIDRIEDDMETDYNQMTDDYEKKMEILNRLIELRDKEQKSRKVEWPKADTIAVIVGGLMEILLIMSYEWGHAITTKAFGRVIRARI